MTPHEVTRSTPYRHEFAGPVDWLWYQWYKIADRVANVLPRVQVHPYRWRLGIVRARELFQTKWKVRWIVAIGPIYLAIK